DMTRPLSVLHTLQVGDGKSVTKASDFPPQPSLRTLCQTMQDRGDPNLAATWILPLK
ncbi:MAG: hypothetical protein ACI89X_000749, partial [Planctomycetota bacterium]